MKHLFPGLPIDLDEIIAGQRKARALVELARRQRASRSLLSYITYVDKTYTPQKFHASVCAIFDQFVEDVENRRSPRYLIFAPPRHGKSTTTTIHGSSYYLGRNPDTWVMNLAYGKDLASTFGRQIRAQLGGRQHRNVFPQDAAMPRADTNAVDFMWLEGGGGYIAEGAGGAITGRGASAMIIDDPLKGREDADSERAREKLLAWYMSVARTRLAPGGGIILTMTPWHEDDLAHTLQKIAADNPEADQWRVFKFPSLIENDTQAAADLLGRKVGEALDPDRYPAEELRRIRASITLREWNALYQCSPTSQEGDFFQADLLERQIVPKSKMPDRACMARYITCDLAITQKTYSDPSVLWPFGVDQNDDIYFFADLIRRKMTPGEIIDSIITLAVRHKAHGVIIERGHIYHALKEALKKRMRERRVYFRILDPSPGADKVSRAQPLQSRMELGKVFFEDGAMVRDVVVPEFLSFPNGANDDCVDSAAWGVNKLNDVRKFVPRKVRPAREAVDPLSREGILISTGKRAARKAKGTIDLFKVRDRVGGRTR